MSKSLSWNDCTVTINNDGVVMVVCDATGDTLYVYDGGGYLIVDTNGEDCIDGEYGECG